jgi:hypothetical protein
LIETSWLFGLSLDHNHHRSFVFVVAIGWLFLLTAAVAAIKRTTHPTAMAKTKSIAVPAGNQIWDTKAAF